MQSFTYFRRAVACSALGALLLPAVAAAQAASPATPVPPPAASAATAAPAATLAEAQQRLEQAAKEVARLSVGGGEREVRIIRMQHGGPEGSRELVTTEVEGGLEGLPGPESIREIRVMHGAAGAHGDLGAQGDPGAGGVAGMPKVGRMHWLPAMQGPRAPGMAHVEVRLAGPLADLELANLSPTLGRYFGAEKGVLVVHANDALQLQDGDVLRTIGGRAATDEHHAMRILGSYAPGEAVKLEVLRDRKTVKLETTVPAAEPAKVKRRVRVQVGAPPAP